MLPLRLRRASQEQLASWNRIEFGYTAPAADQFIGNERELAKFGTPRAPGAPEPIRVAGIGNGDNTPSFPRFVSPLTGKPIDEELVDPAAGRHGDELAERTSATISVPLVAAIGNVRE